MKGVARMSKNAETKTTNVESEGSSSSSSSSTTNNKREELIIAFGTSATTRPLDRNAIKVARDALIEAYGNEVGEAIVVEMSGVVGVFECYTKFVDATGKIPHPRIMTFVMTLVMGTINYFYGWFW